MSSPAPPRPKRDWAYFVDFDGTLVDLAPRPDAVEVTPRHLDVLQQAFAETGSSLAIVSGRTVGDIDTLLDPLRFPVAGLHGLEYRKPDGNVEQGAGLPDHAGLFAAMEKYILERPGLLLEDKGKTLAMHYRQRPDLQSDVRTFVRELAAPFGAAVKVQEGKMVAELKPAGASKGTIVRTFMSFPPFAGRTPVFIGDDLTDEDGFGAVIALDGVAIRVGPLAESIARYSLPSPSALLDWLGQLQS